VALGAVAEAAAVHPPAAVVNADLSGGPGRGVELSAVDRQRVDLVLALGLCDRAAQAGPALAVVRHHFRLPERPSPGAAEGPDVKLSFVHEHRMDQAEERPARPPSAGAVPYVALVVVRDDVEAAQEGCDPEQPPARSRLPAVFPLLSAAIAPDMPGIERLLVDPRPVVAPVGGKQGRRVHADRPDPAR